MKTLSPKEEEIMGFFWEKGPLFVREILTFYPEPRPHFNTISTFVRGLEEKGYVGHTPCGRRSYRYHAAVPREEYSRRNLRTLIREYFNNSYLSVVSSLVKEEHVSLDELKELIQEVEKANQK